MTDADGAGAGGAGAGAGAGGVGAGGSGSAGKASWPLLKILYFRHRPTTAPFRNILYITALPPKIKN